MLAPMRRARIIELVRKEGVATLRQMSQAVGASVSTLRRDVDYLCEVGHLERTHGGAMINLDRLASFEPEPEIATELEQAAKRGIGLHAATLIRPGQTVIFDSGTTTAAAARAARDRCIAFTAFTNDLDIARLLSASAAIQTFVTGGQVRHGSATILGADARQSVARLRADIAFVGTHALTAETLSDTTIELAEFKRSLLNAAQRVVLLADSSKIFSRAFCSFGSTADVSQIVTDDRITAAALDELRARGIVVGRVGRIEQ
ncbi:DeoR/GlpR family DNA-binding transcription regulator [Oceaniglobus indicus]|uniref:DeoR/GlpR family DNA-binding transcription regulator n=1 Tax=Oceaniglobus indicus TaxID=2047749 RepID=UPI0013041AF5|nr:DeoR/GlpR family DNA-binding transcription regulator [Oceaniglobus indicus]